MDPSNSGTSTPSDDDMAPVLDPAVQKIQKDYQDLAEAVVVDAEEELSSLKLIQRIAKCATLDTCIASTYQKKKATSVIQEGYTKELRKLRARKARQAAVLAGMSPQKMQDLTGGYIEKEKRRLQREEEKKKAQASGVPETKPKAKAKKKKPTLAEACALIVRDQDMPQMGEVSPGEQMK